MLYILTQWTFAFNREISLIPSTMYKCRKTANFCLDVLGLDIKNRIKLENAFSLNRTSLRGPGNNIGSRECNTTRPRDMPTSAARTVAGCGGDGWQQGVLKRMKRQRHLLMCFHVHVDAHRERQPQPEICAPIHSRLSLPGFLSLPCWDDPTKHSLRIQEYWGLP